MAVYEGYRVYGPYTRQDGRQHVILISSEIVPNRITVSYPKYLVELHLGRQLGPDETVDHIDGNFQNNDLSNLRIVPRAKHALSHVLRKKEVRLTCIVCGKSFTTKNASRVTCGSKKCRGACAHVLGYNQGCPKSKRVNEYISCRSLIEEIQSVEGANSGKSLVDNPEQG